MSDPILKGMSHELSSSVSYGEGVTIWQYATICEHTKLGTGVVVGSGVWIGRYCDIGDYTRLQHGVFLPPRTVVGRGVFVGPNVTLCDDKYPKAGFSYKANPPVLKDNCSIGAGAVILPGVVIGEHAMIGAGAVVTQDVPAYHQAVGVPATCTPLP